MTPKIFFLMFSFSMATARSPVGCKILDLTMKLDEKTPYYPVYQQFKLTNRQSGPWNKDVPYVEWNLIELYEHTGTHVDAPSHFSRYGKKIDEVNLEHFVGEACVLDISSKVAQNRDYQMSLQDVYDWEYEHGVISPDCIFLLHTGQGKWHRDRNKFFGVSDPRKPQEFHFAAFTGVTAEYIVNKGVKGLGVDAISLDGSQDHFFKAHHAILHKGKIPGIENLINLDKLPARNATIIAAPLNIKKGSGSPLRAFAIGWEGSSDPCSLSQMRMTQGGSKLAGMQILSVFGAGLTVMLTSLLL